MATLTHTNPSGPQDPILWTVCDSARVFEPAETGRIIGALRARSLEALSVQVGRDPRELEPVQEEWSALPSDEFGVLVSVLIGVLAAPEVLEPA